MSAFKLHDISSFLIDSVHIGFNEYQANLVIYKSIRYCMKRHSGSAQRPKHKSDKFPGAYWYNGEELPRLV